MQNLSTSSSAQNPREALEYGVVKLSHEAAALFLGWKHQDLLTLHDSRTDIGIDMVH